MAPQTQTKQQKRASKKKSTKNEGSKNRMKASAKSFDQKDTRQKGKKRPREAMANAVTTTKPKRHREATALSGATKTNVRLNAPVF